MGWTAERISVASKLWVDGLSASQIAVQLGGVTRNAVLGKINRMGLSGRAAPSQPRTVTVRLPKTPRVRLNVAKPMVAAEPPPEVAKSQEEAERRADAIIVATATRNALRESPYLARIAPPLIEAALDAGYRQASSVVRADNRDGAVLLWHPDHAIAVEARHLADTRQWSLTWLLQTTAELDPACQTIRTNTFEANVAPLARNGQLHSLVRGTPLELLHDDDVTAEPVTIDDMATTSFLAATRLLGIAEDTIQRHWHVAPDWLGAEGLIFPDQGVTAPRPSEAGPAAAIIYPNFAESFGIIDPIAAADLEKMIRLGYQTPRPIRRDRTPADDLARSLRLYL